MTPNEQTKLVCHKHGESLYLTVTVAGQADRFWCLDCFEEMLTRQGVHGMFPAALGQTDSRLIDEWPVELEEVK